MSACINVWQDYVGQKWSEYLYYYIIIICGAIGWVIGWWHESFLLTFYGWLVGVGVSLLVREWVERYGPPGLLQADMVLGG